MDVTFIILGALVFVAVIWVLFSAGFIKKPARTLEDIANSEEEDLQTVKWASEPSEERKHEESPYTVKHFDRPLYHGTTSGIFAILGLTQDYRLLSYDQLMEEDIVPFGGELLYGIQFEKGVSHDNVSFSESLSTATAEYARPQSNDLVGQILRYVDRRATEKLACPKCNYHKFPDEEIDDCNKCGSDLTRTKELQHEYRTIAIPLKNGLTPELFSSLKDLEKRDSTPDLHKALQRAEIYIKRDKLYRELPPKLQQYVDWDFEVVIEIPAGTEVECLERVRSAKSLSEVPIKAPIDFSGLIFYVPEEHVDEVKALGLPARIGVLE